MKFTWSLIALFRMPLAIKSLSTAVARVAYCMY